MINAVGKPGSCCCNEEVLERIRWSNFEIGVGHRGLYPEYNNLTHFETVFGTTFGTFGANTFNTFATGRVELQLDGTGQDRIATLSVFLTTVDENPVWTYLRMEGHDSDHAFNPVNSTQGKEITFSVTQSPSPFEGDWTMHVRLLYRSVVPSSLPNGIITTVGITVGNKSFRESDAQLGEI